MIEDVVQPVLNSITTSGDSWPVLVLIIVIAAIVYLAVYWTSLQAKVAKDLVIEQTLINEQRLVDRKEEFAHHLDRERLNTSQYEAMTTRMIDAYNQNSKAMSEMAAVLRPMAEAYKRIERYMERDAERGRSQ